MNKSHWTLIRSRISLSFIALPILAFVLWASSASAFETYSADGSAGNCANCHGDFNSGDYQSLTGDDGAAWLSSNGQPTDLMSGHLGAYDMPNSCGECHKDSGRSPVYLNPLSDPDGDSAGLGCVGCHGRIEDITPGDSIGAAPNNWGDGLRAHHASAGVTTCAGCHSVDSVQVGEEVPPETFAILNIDACDENGAAAGTGNFGNVGLDNDGDGLREPVDPDCQIDQAPTADPNGPYNAQVGESITFDGSGSTDDGTIVSYEWDFGDGTAMGMGVAPTHTYGSAGTFTVTLTVTDDGGLTDMATTTATITAQPMPPVSDPNGPYSGQVGDNIAFDGSGSSDPDGNIVSYMWDFGDGTAMGMGITPTHTYGSAGTFTVTLEVIDNDGLTDTATTTATISAQPQPPVADPNGPYSGLVGDSIAFDGSGSSDPDGNIVTYAWDFGDGSSGSGQNPTHSYSGAGTFTVTLTVTDNDGLTGSASTTATISPQPQPPVADPNGPYSGLVGDSIAFDGSGSSDPDGNIVTYAWDFGDGSSGSGQNPTHSYSGAGTFTVTLTVTDNDGLTGSASTTATISPQPQPPVADPNGPYSGLVGDSIAFDGSGSSDPDGNIVTYAWDFGDGSSGSGQNPTHSYSSAGTFSVTLTVTDNDGLTGSASTAATISPQPVAPTADPNGPYAAQVGESITFDGSGSVDPDGNIVSYDWNFGDGGTGTGVSPSHAYSAEGTFTVTLTVTDNDGLTGSASTTATISPQPVAPTANPNGPYSALVGDSITFDGSGSVDPDGNIVSYDWNFGDGGTGTGVSPSHAYTAEGTFTVTLTVTDNDGLTGSASTTATISPQPVAPTANPNGPYSALVGDSITFDGSGSVDPDGNIVSYDWNFGDGTTGTGVGPSHAYSAEGTFTVTLTVTDNDGLTGSASTTATISPQPVAPTANPNGPYSALVGDSITFDGSGSSDPDGSIVSYDWDFGDGGTGTGVNPSYAYSADGTFTVTLTVTDNDGLTNSATTTATISAQPQPPVANPNGPYGAQVGESITFDGSGSSDPDGSIVSYDWDFGDGGTGTGVNPSYAYSADGTFTVTLTVTDNDGLTNSATTTATISAQPQPPVADPNGPYGAQVGESITFDGSGSSDPDGSIVSYDWDFGDGGTGTGVSPSYAYGAEGSFTVTLTVTDNDGLTNSATTTATISAQPQPPVADPNGPYSGQVGDNIAFDGSGSSDPDGSIVSYDWDFGDGGTGTGVAPMHTYSVDGVFTVTLTVTDNDGLTGSASTTATISAQPVAPTADPNGPYAAQVGESITFDGSGSSDPDGNIVTYAWDFGDGTAMGTGVMPTHAYSAAGTYDVTLTVTDSDGLTDTASTTATISQVQPLPPISDPNGPYTGTVGSPVSFDGSGSSDPDGNIVSYAWDFGDGTAMGMGAAPTHTYGAADTYTVTLTVTDNDGLSNTASTTATIREPGGGGEGCSPGYWKQSQHFDSWAAPYAPDTSFGAVFDDAYRGLTLLAVAAQRGNDLNALGRQTVAALLNAASPDVSYDLTVDEVITAFNDVYPGSKNDYKQLLGFFKGFNSQVCPLTEDDDDEDELPRQARSPNPASGASNVTTDVVLSWTAGTRTESQEVYFGTSVNPPLVSTQTGSSYDPGTLTEGTTYYWRVDGVNSFGTTTGSLWSFSTGDGGMCGLRGESCTVDSDCCSNKCKDKSGVKTCN
ncbi:MAG: PKD domain-containing protein [Gammaproteobacteria bacterium]|nr:PKD domain-containing protein [Gammaproteobacteria bacterium]